MDGAEITIKDILAGIYSEVNNDRSVLSPALMDGMAGRILFKFLYLRYMQSPHLADELEEDVHCIAESAAHCRSMAFCSGKSGTDWFFRFLAANRVLSAEDCAFLCEDDRGLEEQALGMLDTGNADFLYGAVGIAHHLLYDRSIHNEGFYQQFFRVTEGLKSRSRSGRVIPYFDLSEGSIVPGRINFGLAHGFPSLLKFCLECYRAGICRDRSGEMAHSLVAFLLEHVREDKTVSYFPSRLDEEDASPSHSRLAWCYGDLGNAFILYQAGMILDERRLVGLAMTIFKHAAGRRTSGRTGIVDATFCHGSSGVAYIFDKMGRLSGDLSLKGAGDHWIAETISLRTHNDSISGYKTYYPAEKKFEMDSGLLNGSAGIGLALLSHVTGCYDWDYCMMLNN